MAGWPASLGFNCRLLAPTELGEGQWEVSPLIPGRLGDIATEVSAGGASANIFYWPLDNQNVLRFFDAGAFQQEYRGGGVYRRVDDTVLLAIPGEDCFYEISGVFSFERGWSMVLLDWFWASLKRIETPAG